MTTRQRQLQLIVDKLTGRQEECQEQLDYRAQAGLIHTSGVLAEEIVRLEHIIQRAKAEIG